MSPHSTATFLLSVIQSLIHSLVGKSLSWKMNRNCEAQVKPPHSSGRAFLLLGRSMFSSLSLADPGQMVMITAPCTSTERRRTNLGRKLAALQAHTSTGGLPVVTRSPVIRLSWTSARRAPTATSPPRVRWRRRLVFPTRNDEFRGAQPPRSVERAKRPSKIE